MDYQILSESPSAWVLGARALEPVRLDSGYYGPSYLDAMARLRSLACGVQPLRKLCTKLNCGATPKDVRYGGTGMALIRTTNVRPNLYDPADTKRVPGLALPDSDNRVILPGDVLYTMSGTVGYAAVYPENLEAASCSNTIARGRIRPGSGHDPYFVAAFLNSSLGYAQSMRLVSGGVLGHVMPTSVKELLVPTPDPDLQRAIGNRLRKAERLREGAFRALTHAERTLGALTGSFPRTPQRTSSVQAADLEFARLDAEFYQPHFLAADAWIKAHRTDTLESVMLSGSYGVLPDSEDYGKGTLRFLRATNVGHLYVDETKALRVPASYAQPKGITRTGDVLLEVKGMIAGGAVCPPEADGFLVNGSIFRIRPKPSIDPHYLAAVLVGPLGVVQKQRAASNSVISYVSIDFVRSLRIPRFGHEVEREIGDLVRSFVDGRRDAQKLVEAGRNGVETLIDGTLDEVTLLAESDAIERWLTENPSPSHGA